MSTRSEIVRRTSAIQGTALHQARPAEWLERAIQVAQRMPVVIDVPGVPADQVPCVVPLAELERLRRDAALLADLRVLMPDRVDQVEQDQASDIRKCAQRSGGLQHRGARRSGGAVM